MADLSFDQAHFDAIYRENSDPWNYRTSVYERDKYTATLNALPRERYKHAIELGCSIGELTALLCTRADRLTAVDTSRVALDVATHRCVGVSNVQFVQAQLPGGDWDKPSDLVVLSEILYFLDASAIDHLAARLAHCAPRADMVLVHWTGATNYPLSGNDAVAQFIGAVPTHAVTTLEMPLYRLDVMTHRVR